jgi:hypothetical protein
MNWKQLDPKISWPNRSTMKEFTGVTEKTKETGNGCNCRLAKIRAKLLPNESP